jgi:hypothetical protein
LAPEILLGMGHGLQSICWLNSTSYHMTSAFS